MVNPEGIPTASDPQGIPWPVLSLVANYIPKKEHAVAVCVSKDWNLALRPSEWSTTRSKLCLKKEPSLYIRIKIKSCHNWYILNENQNPQLSDNSPFASTNLELSATAMAVLGSKIYFLGGASDGLPINNVWAFDCASSTMESGPRMLYHRDSSVAEVVNGIVYVMGGRLIKELDENSNQVVGWMEKFDPVAGLWEVVSCPVNITKNRASTSCVVEGRIYAMAFNNWIVFSPIKEEWSIIESKTSNLRCRGKPAVLDGVIYFQQFSGDITGYDVNKNKWKKLKVQQWKEIKVGNNERKEIKVMFPKFLDAVTIAALNGNLFVLWEKRKITHEHMNEKLELTQGGVKVGLMCVEIEVSKGNNGKLNGLVLWQREILQLPSNSSAVHCLPVYV